MTRGDALMERGAGRLQRLADRAAASGGLAAKLAEPLAEDAALLRRMKPSLMVARAKGEAPTDLEPGRNAPHERQLEERPKEKVGPNPFVVIGVALVVGIALAKFVDWREHAHPRG